MMRRWVCLFLCLPTGVVLGAVTDSVPVLEIRRQSGWEGAASVEIRPPWNDPGRVVARACFFFDDSLLHFAFYADDTTVNLFTSGDELSVTKGDRMELFFASSGDLSDYFCFEISPAGKVLDYRAKYKRQFDYGWHLPGLSVTTHIGSKGYVVRGEIPMSFIRRLWGRVQGDRRRHALYAGVFSADYYGEKEEDVVWNSWVIPMSDKPDFHIPSALGRFILYE